MNRYIITHEGKKIEVNIYQTKWRMNAASIKRKSNLQGTTHNTIGTCHRWWVNYSDHVVAVIMLSWDTITIDVLCHELLHAAIHVWTYEKQDKGKKLSCDNDETLCYIHSDFVQDMMELFDKSQIDKMIRNGNTHQKPHIPVLTENNP